MCVVYDVLARLMEALLFQVLCLFNAQALASSCAICLHYYRPSRRSSPSVSVPPSCLGADNPAVCLSDTLLLRQ
jgi:hypothetical protein